MFMLITMLYRDQDHNLARNLNGLDIKLLHPYLRNRHRKNTILHSSLNLIHLSIFRSLNLLKNLPLLHSTLCHVSFFSSFSTFLSSLIWSTLSSSTSTFASSFLSPGRLALNTRASGVSFQSMQVLTTA